MVQKNPKLSLFLFVHRKKTVLCIPHQPWAVGGKSIGKAIKRLKINNLKLEFLFSDGKF